jgi:ribonucleotide reductase alpha subunit
VFAEEDREARTLLEPILESFVGRPLTEVRVARSVIQLRTASKYVVKFLADLGVKPVGTDKAAPRSLFTATEEAVVGFLKGLFSSDGTIYSQQESRYTIRLNSSSLTLLKDVQLLLLNLGIYSNIYDRSTEPKPFHYTTAKGDLKTYSTSGINYELSINGQNLVKFIKKIGFIKSRHRAIAQEILSAYTRGPYSEDFVAPIESIEYVGEKEVWDITESITHSFIANGLVVHNCGEVLLYPNESCNLGSINVWAFARRDENGKVTYDWDNLREAIYLASRFLDNVIDVNNFPLKSIEDMTLATRKIGLGVMGLADLLLEMRSPYNSDEGRKFMEELMEFINYHSKLASIEMAKERGPVPYFDKSFYPEGRLPFAGFYDRKSWHFDWDKVAEMIKRHGVRNGYTTVIAPTGSISMIAGCSSGIEPIYSLVYEKHVKVGSFYYIDPVFERVMTEEGLFGEDLLRDVNDHGGSIQKISYIPEDLKRVYITAMDIRPEDHIRALAAFQRWTDSSISKTNNFPANATVEDMRESYLLAYKLGCKDVTVFRDTSIKGQVLVAPRKKQEPNTEHNSTTNDQAARAPQLLTMPLVGGSGVSEQVKLCPQCTTQVVYQEGCYICPECGWGACA